MAHFAHAAAWANRANIVTRDFISMQANNKKKTHKLKQHPDVDKGLKSLHRLKAGQKKILQRRSLLEEPPNLTIWLLNFSLYRRSLVKRSNDQIYTFDSFAASDCWMLPWTS